MQVKITRVFRKQKTSAAGKPYTSLGIKTEEHGDKWLSGFDSAQTRNWKEGDTVEIMVEEKGQYLNFAVPKDRGPAANNAAAAELKNLLTLKVLPELADIKKEIVILAEKLDMALGNSENVMPHFPEPKDVIGPEDNPHGSF